MAKISRTAAYRARRFATKPPRGHRWCSMCATAKPEQDFFYNHGERKVCKGCADRMASRAVQKAAWKREWLKDPVHKEKARQLYKDFTTKKKPWIWPFYSFRRMVSELLQRGDIIRGVVEGLPDFAYGERCRDCGSTNNLQVFWPDYSKPQAMHRYCPRHRRIRSFTDTRTLEQQAEEAALGIEEIARLRAVLLKVGVSHYKLVEKWRKRAS